MVLSHSMPRVRCTVFDNVSNIYWARMYRDEYLSWQLYHFVLRAFLYTRFSHMLVFFTSYTLCYIRSIFGLAGVAKCKILFWRELAKGCAKNTSRMTVRCNLCMCIRCTYIRLGTRPDRSSRLARRWTNRCSQSLPFLWINVLNVCHRTCIHS
jgi:hypothetical protein